MVLRQRDAQPIRSIEVLRVRLRRLPQQVNRLRHVTLTERIQTLLSESRCSRWVIHFSHLRPVWCG